MEWWGQSKFRFGFNWVEDSSSLRERWNNASAEQNDFPCCQKRLAGLVYKQRSFFPSRTNRPYFLQITRDWAFSNQVLDISLRLQELHVFHDWAFGNYPFPKPLQFSKSKWFREMGKWDICPTVWRGDGGQRGDAERTGVFEVKTRS